MLWLVLAAGSGSSSGCIVGAGSGSGLVGGSGSGCCVAGLGSTGISALVPCLVIVLVCVWELISRNVYSLVLLSVCGFFCGQHFSYE